MTIDAADAVRLYGRHAADIIIDCKRRVALADPAEKLSAYSDALRTLVDVADQWLPKDRAVDVAHDIAVAHDFFGIGQSKLQGMMADAFRLTKTQKPSPGVPPKRQLLTHRASDLTPEKLDWIWAGRITEIW